jgi:hypothetical protein
MFRSCVVFINCCPRDLPTADSKEIDLMAIRCHFVIAAALTATARTEDRVDEQLQRYIETRQQIALFEVRFHSTTYEWEEEIRTDLTGKLSTLLAFDFESTICLKNWEDLNQIVRKAQACQDEILLKAMGDCLLRSRAPGKGRFSHGLLLPFFQN